MSPLFCGRFDLFDSKGQCCFCRLLHRPLSRNHNDSFQVKKIENVKKNPRFIRTKKDVFYVKMPLHVFAPAENVGVTVLEWRVPHLNSLIMNPALLWLS